MNAVSSDASVQTEALVVVATGKRAKIKSCVFRSLWIGVLLGLLPFDNLAFCLLAVLPLFVRTRVLIIAIAAGLAFLARPTLDPIVDPLGSRMLAFTTLKPLWTSLTTIPIVVYTRWYNSISLAYLTLGFTTLPMVSVCDRMLAFSIAKYLWKYEADIDPIASPRTATIAAPSEIVSQEFPSSDTDITPLPGTLIEQDLLSCDTATQTSTTDLAVPQVLIDTVEQPTVHPPHNRRLRKYQVTETIIDIIRFRQQNPIAAAALRSGKASNDKYQGPASIPILAGDTSQCGGNIKRHDSASITAKAPILLPGHGDNSITASESTKMEPLPFLVSYLSGYRQVGREAS